MGILALAPKGRSVTVWALAGSPPPGAIPWVSVKRRTLLPDILLALIHWILFTIHLDLTSQSCPGWPVARAVGRTPPLEPSMQPHTSRLSGKLPTYQGWLVWSKCSRRRHALAQKLEAQPSGDNLHKFSIGKNSPKELHKKRYTSEPKFKDRKKYPEYNWINILSCNFFKGYVYSQKLMAWQMQIIVYSGLCARVLLVIVMNESWIQEKITFAAINSVCIKHRQ